VADQYLPTGEAINRDAQARKLSPEERSNLLDVWVEDRHGLRPVGVLERYPEAGYPVHSTVVFFYHNGLADEDAVSITMPIRRDGYQSKLAGLSGNLPPIFDQNIPEGALHDYLVRRYMKVVENMGDFDLLRLAGNRSIGRIRVVPHGVAPSPFVPQSPTAQAILADPDAQKLLDALFEQLAEYSGVSGVQPKVLLEGQVDASLVLPKPSNGRRLTIQNDGYIVKASGRDYPGLAINEYLCLYACEMSGLNTAKAALSDDGSVLVLSRFDKDPEGRPLGFEDMACLSGYTSQDKYKGSYEDMIKILRLMIEPDAMAVVLPEVFKSIALTCVLGNGDGHLKNFGLLYTDPTRSAYLAPAFDICCTLAYLPDDQLALSMNKSKNFPNRATLTKFGRISCLLKPKEINDILKQVEMGVEAAAIELEYYRKHDPEFYARCGQGMRRAWKAGMRHTLAMGDGYELPGDVEIKPV